MTNQSQNQFAKLDDGNWITITEAAKMFSRTRAAIEQHIKGGRLESKRLGSKQLIHVHKPSVTSLFASFAKPIQQTNTAKHDERPLANYDNSLQSTIVNELGSLGHVYKNLLDEAKGEISQLKIELSKQREENKDLQKELLKLMHEMQGLLKKETGLMSWLRSKSQ